MSLPVGTVVGMLGQDPANPPDGWLYCNGGTFDSQKYPELAQILSNNTLPNLAGLTLIGASNGGSYPPSNLGKSAANQNDDGTYGNASHTLSVDEMPSHQHFGFGESNPTWPYGAAGSNNPGSGGGYDDNNYLYGTTSAGGSLPFPLMQPSYAIYFFICASSDV